MVQQMLWEKLAHEPPDETCRRTGAEYDAATGRLTLRVLDAVLVADTAAQTLGFVDPVSGAPAGALDVSAEVAACAYLVSAKDVPLAHNWITPQELPSGAMFFRGQHAVSTAGLEAAFGTSVEAFHAAAEAAGGCRLTFADASHEFRVFPRLPVAVLLWVADDEFPARVRFLVDETAGEHLALDAMLGVFEMVASRLIGQAP